MAERRGRTGGTLDVGQILVAVGVQDRDPRIGQADGLPHRRDGQHRTQRHEPATDEVIEQASVAAKEAGVETAPAVAFTAHTPAQTTAARRRIMARAG